MGVGALIALRNVSPGPEEAATNLPGPDKDTASDSSASAAGSARTSDVKSVSSIGNRDLQYDVGSKPSHSYKYQVSSHNGKRATNWKGVMTLQSGSPYSKFDKANGAKLLAHETGFGFAVSENYVITSRSLILAKLSEKGVAGSFGETCAIEILVVHGGPKSVKHFELNSSELKYQFALRSLKARLENESKEEE